MKTMIFKNWMTALLLTCACFGLVACDKNDTPTDITDVIGTYNGNMTLFNIGPVDGNGKASEPVEVDAVMTNDLILLEDFPIRDLVINVIGDEALADQIVAKIGKVDYSIPYTAEMSEDNADVNLMLTPAPLKLTLLNENKSGKPESFEEPTSIEIEVEIVTEGNGAYTIESKNMVFRISAASVRLNGGEYPTFKPFTLAFDLNKQ